MIENSSTRNHLMSRNQTDKTLKSKTNLITSSESFCIDTLTSELPTITKNDMLQKRPNSQISDSKFAKAYKMKMKFLKQKVLNSKDLLGHVASQKP